MAAKFLIRLDDACPTMRKKNWQQFEECFDRLGIRPIVGVVPENADEKLMIDPYDHDFWEKISGWQEKNWTIALHGLSHRYHQIPISAQQYIPLHKKSEFVGLTFEEQKEILSRSYQTFVKHNINPTIFMAPSHSFDLHTLDALSEVTPIRMITDGYALWPFRERGFVWIPQQIWRIRKFPFGIWTVCIHPNDLAEREIEEMVNSMEEHKGAIIGLDDLEISNITSKSISNVLFAGVYMKMLWLKKRFSRR